MAIGKDKDKVVSVVSKTTKQKLEELAEKDNRSLSNYCSIILENYVAGLKDEK
jgi:hypothetical protein